MSIKRHLTIGSVVILAIFFALLFVFPFRVAAFITTTLLAQTIATDAALFIIHYRKVNWKGSPWGRHVMRLCFILGVTFEAVVIVNVLYAIHRYEPRIVSVLTILLYGAIAAEMHNRRYLEKRAQKEKSK